MSTVRLKKGFTLIEITVVVIIIGIILTIIPLRMQGLREHTDMSLAMQQREDLRQRSITSMRQGHRYAAARIEMMTGYVQVTYSGGSEQGAIETLALPAGTSVQSEAGNLARNMNPYAVACDGYNTGFSMSVGKLRSCYRVDLSACALVHVPCN